jgi:hypothetical protein
MQITTGNSNLHLTLKLIQAYRVLKGVNKMLNKLKQINSKLSTLWKQLNSLIDDNPLIIDIFSVMYFWVLLFIIIIPYLFSENCDFIRLFVTVGILGSLAMFMMCTYWVVKVIKYIISRTTKVNTND